MSRSKRYEFDQYTKDIIIAERQRCEICGGKKQLQVHHRYVYVWEAQKYKIPASIVRSKNNGQLVCRSCHNEIHNDERTKQDLMIGLSLIMNALGYYLKDDVLRSIR